MWQKSYLSFPSQKLSRPITQLNTVYFVTVSVPAMLCKFHLIHNTQL